MPTTVKVTVVADAVMNSFSAAASTRLKFTVIVSLAPTAMLERMLTAAVTPPTPTETVAALAAVLQMMICLTIVVVADWTRYLPAVVSVDVVTATLGPNGVFAL